MSEEQTTTLVVSPGPHLHASVERYSLKSTQEIMFLVCAALAIPLFGGIILFGIYTLFVVLVSVVTAVLTEYVCKMLRKREFVMDGSAVITGMLFAMVMPPRIPLWVVVIGSAFAIGIVKEAFGGLGHNIFNPALAGRAFLAVSFAGLMTRWVAPMSQGNSDVYTTATPLSESFVKSGTTNELYWDLFTGNVGGCIGETSVLLILSGGIILLVFGVIKWRIPVVYIGTVFLLTWLIPGEDPVLHILSGGLFLGAFFMATDYVTAPLTDKGQFIFAAGAGVLVVMIRLYGSMPEGVAFSILLMNAFTPLIDRYVRPKPYGYIPPEKPEETDEKKDEKPKKEEKKPEKPKPEEPKAEAPKPKEPKPKEPKAEEPKPDDPKPEEPKAEEPKAEEPQEPVNEKPDAGGEPS